MSWNHVPDPLPLEAAVGQTLMIAFQGKDALSDDCLHALRQYRPAGITLFRSFNIDTPHQVRRLTALLQGSARDFGLPPLLIGADQEGGQLMAIGEGTTQLPGNMALGAAGSTRLAYEAGQVLGRELAAMGINVAYAPACDVNLNPHNPVIGVRSFGEDAQQVGRLAAALIEGIQACGVVATAKHFPGHGDTASDSHHGVPVVPHSLERLRSVELPPFVAAIEAGVKLVMSGHLALPAVTGRTDLPATLSPQILGGILREELRFAGPIITDAMDMHAIGQGEALGDEALRALQAGIDLLLLTSNPADQQRVYERLLAAARSGEWSGEERKLSNRRVLGLKSWLAENFSQPDMSVVGSAAHQSVADEIAAASITLVRDRAGLLPLRLNADDRVAVILPQPIDLTPADTSSYIVPALAQALRVYHPAVDEFFVPHAPSDTDIAAVLQRLPEYKRVIVGTLNAVSTPAQAELVNAILDSGCDAIVAALRLPYDLACFPQAPTYLCTYSILEPSMQALARVLTGLAPAPGRLPVTIPGL
jgi:beta-N-acetylhexosaminidase